MRNNDYFYRPDREPDINKTVMNGYPKLILIWIIDMTGEGNAEFLYAFPDSGENYAEGRCSYARVDDNNYLSFRHRRIDPLKIAENKDTLTKEIKSIIKDFISNKVDEIILE